MHYLKKILANKFVKNVLVLITGTALGQLVSIITLPILTRIYSPESFTVLAVYISVLTIIASIVCLCFEYAIPLPKKDEVAAALTILSILSTLLITCITIVLVLIFPEAINKLTEGKISNFLWLIPAGVFAIGIYNSLQYWGTRKKKFGLIAKTRVTQSISGTLVKLSAGYFFVGSTIGLIVGQLVSQSAGFVTLGKSILKNDIKYFKKIKLKHIIFALHKYQNFPKFTTLSVLSNNASIQIPIIIIAYFGVGAEAGFLMIAIQLISAPLGMLSGAISQVYLAEGADKYNEKALESFTKKTIFNLIKISFIPLVILFFVSPVVIPFVLGDEWLRTGVLISWMVPWFFVQFIVSPVSTALYFTNNQKLSFGLQLFGLLLRVCGVFLAGVYSSKYISEVYVITGVVFYLVYLIVILKVIKNK